MNKLGQFMLTAVRRLMTAFPNEGMLNEKAQALLRELGYAANAVLLLVEMDWSPDESFLLVQALDRNGNEGIHRFNLESRKSEPLLTRNNDQNSSGGDWNHCPRISPDGKWFYYDRRKFFQEGSNWNSSDFSLHPDGRQMAVQAGPGDKHEVWVMENAFPGRVAAAN